MTASGTIPANTHRQPKADVTSPASAGPTSAGTTQAADSAAKTRGRRPGATARATTT